MASSWPPTILTALPLMRRRGPGNKSLVDGVTDRRVGRSGAFGTHVALRCESRHQIVFGGAQTRVMVRCGTDS